MANENKPITELPPGTTLGATDLLVYVDMSGTPTTKKITEANAAIALAVSGYSGYPGLSGFSGFSGVGTSGFSGFSGVATSGFSGFSGAGTSGFSGFSGLNGAAAASGFSGFSGISGYSGFTGVSGFSGFSGLGTITAAHVSDDTYTGIVLIGLNAGATIAQWETVYLGGSSTWLLADANGSGTYPARGLAVAGYSNTDPATILTYGTVRNDAWSWTVAGPLYLSATQGGLTQTAPSTSGDQVQVVGYALTADVAFFDFNSVYLTVT